MSRVGQRIKEERLKKGLSPKQLGKKCGVTESYILDIENGFKIINEKMLSQVSKVLGTNLEESMVLEKSAEDKKDNTGVSKKSNGFTNNPSAKRSDVEPLPQWEEAFSNIIKKVPIYDMKMTNIKGYKEFPIINKKVEGFNPDKLVYVLLSDDSLKQYRLKEGDRCLIYLNPEFKNNSFHLVEYDGNRFLRKVKSIGGNKIQLIEGTKDDKTIIKDLKNIKIIGKLIRVEIDF